MSNFRRFDRATGFLLPPSLDEWLPERHLARFVVDATGGVLGVGLAMLLGRLILVALRFDHVRASSLNFAGV
jgi:hypothetical protein